MHSLFLYALSFVAAPTSELVDAWFCRDRAFFLDLYACPDDIYLRGVVGGERFAAASAIDMRGALDQVDVICSVYPDDASGLMSCDVVAEDVGGDVKITVVRSKDAAGQPTAPLAYVEGFEQTISEAVPCQRTQVDAATAQRFAHCTPTKF